MLISSIHLEGFSSTASNSMRLPKGATADRPQTSLAQSGMVRYNTTSDPTANPSTTSLGLEVYHDGAWRTVRFKGASTITKQTLSPVGNAVETVFGPLTYVPATADNIIVLVENCSTDFNNKLYTRTKC